MDRNCAARKARRELDGPCFHIGIAIAWLVLTPVLAIAPSGALAQTAAIEAPLPPQLTIASWSLDAARKAGVIHDPKAAPPRTWRHTFGAQLRSPAKVVFDVRTPDADVVLLQGVSRVSDARRLLPARGWKLIVSRQLAERSGTAPDGAPTLVTAVAVRYRQGLRISGQQHLPELVAPALLGQSEPAAAGAAGTAIRLLADGKALWLISVSLAATCQKAATLCPTRDKLEDWIAARRQAGETVIVGGRGGATVQGAETLGACGEQAIARYAPQGATATSAIPPAAEVDEAGGCLVSVALARP